MGRIVRDHEELSQVLKVFRSQEKSIVFASGCFDLLHLGHVNCLSDAASRGDFFVVAVHSDAVAKKLHGPDRPFQKAEARAEMVSAFTGIDYVTVMTDPDLEVLLKMLRPTFFATGVSGCLDQVEAEVLEEVGAELISLEGDRGHSTETLIAKIRSAATAAPKTRKVTKKKTKARAEKAE